MTATTPAHEPQWLVFCPEQADLHWLPAETTLVALEDNLRSELLSRLVAAA